MKKAETINTVDKGERADSWNRRRTDEQLLAFIAMRETEIFATNA